MPLASVLQGPRAFLAAVGTGLLLSASSAACVDPAGALDDFNERAAEADFSTSTTSGAGGGDACAVPAAGEVDGNYLFALSAKIAKTKPVLFYAKLTTEDASGLNFSLNLQPLNAKDRKTPEGDAIDVGPYPVAADGTFSAALPMLTVAGAANPVSGSLLEATVTLVGTLCAPADFICGDVTGSVTKPIAIPDLTGSAFTMQRITDEAAYPEPLINCAGDPAEPPPS
jgi:hypothetical protein